MTEPRHGPGGESGSAVVDFVLVGALITLVFVSVVQLAVVQHVRNTLIDCAEEGARYGALADEDPQAGVDRARALITADLSARYAADVEADRVRIDGLDTVEIRVRAPLPVVGFFGSGRALHVSGHAVAEQP
jgi:TadE-like protein